ncbi:MAG: hypothetical protein QOI40_250 [Alphaproteobacteria bacterium]|jgi:hypothetical protein|nr:hypothetical protein [Alphaproteobacteria bacterium]
MAALSFVGMAAVGALSGHSANARVGSGALGRTGDRKVAGTFIRSFCGRCKARYDSCRADEAELLQGRYPVVKTDFLKDLSALEFQHGGAGELHLAAGVGRQ